MYIFDKNFLLPEKNVNICIYTDDITITVSRTEHLKAQQFIQSHLHKFYEWATSNNL